MTTTAWAHLPNAAHIDRVIASAKANPGQWKKLWVSVRPAAWIGELDSTHDTTWNAAWEAAQCTIASQERQGLRDAVGVEARDAAWCALLALVAYDDCAYMLDSDPGELAILAAFGDPRAVLILPACEILHSLKEIV